MGNYLETEGDIDTSLLEWLNQVRDLVMDRVAHLFRLEIANMRDTEGMNIQEMNDHCLMETFSANTLGPMDLCSLVETCIHFQQITLRIAPKTLRILYATAGSLLVHFGTLYRGTRKDIKRIFKNFGSRLLTVKIEGFYDPVHNPLLELVIKHCNDGNLKNLSLRFTHVPSELVEKLKPIIKPLEKLDLYCVCRIKDPSLFAEMESLVELTVDDVFSYGTVGTVLNNNFPKPERFSYGKSMFIMESFEKSVDALKSFISRHRSLKRLKLFICSDDSSQTDILESIGNNCQSLKNLNLYIGMITVSSLLQPIQTLKLVQTLQLSSVSFPDFKFFIVLTNLRELTLANCNLPKDVDEFRRLMYLNKLSLQLCGTIDVIGVIDRLKYLKIFKYWDTLNVATVFKIVSIVKERPTGLLLKSFFNFKVKSYRDRQNVRLVQLPQ